MMRRVLLALILMILARASYTFASGVLSGGVNFHANVANYPPTVFSAGDAEYSGTESYTLVGTHQIVNVVSHSFSKYYTHYNYFIQGDSDYYQCHTASLNVNVFPTDIANTWRTTGCVPGPPPPPPDEPPLDQCYEYCSPIIVGLEDGEIQLSGAADPVTFDIDADGLAERITWTAAGSPVAFLALDRNGNGMIDSGRELFGNATLLSTGGTAKNGYVALAEFDRLDMGGNNDGVIAIERKEKRDRLSHEPPAELS